MEIIETHDIGSVNEWFDLQDVNKNIIDKILIGKMNKFYEENCLLQQKFVKDDKTTVEKFANPMKLNGFERFKVGEGIEKKEEDFAAEVAAQIKG